MSADKSIIGNVAAGVVLGVAIVMAIIALAVSVIAWEDGRHRSSGRPLSFDVLDSGDAPVLSVPSGGGFTSK